MISRSSQPWGLTTGTEINCMSVRIADKGRGWDSDGIICLDGSIHGTRTDKPSATKDDGQQ